MRRDNRPPTVAVIYRCPEKASDVSLMRAYYCASVTTGCLHHPIIITVVISPPFIRAMVSPSRSYASYPLSHVIMAWTTHPIHKDFLVFLLTMRVTNIQPPTILEELSVTH
jgi:hypothetical protein